MLRPSVVTTDQWLQKLLDAVAVEMHEISNWQQFPLNYVASDDWNVPVGISVADDIEYRMYFFDSMKENLFINF